MIINFTHILLLRYRWKKYLHILRWISRIYFGLTYCTTARQRCGATAERCGSSSSVVFQNYKFNFATENSEQLLSVFVTGSVVMTVILNTTFVLWLTAQSVHCTLLQPGCTKIFNGLDLIQFSVANGTAGG